MLRIRVFTWCLSDSESGFTVRYVFWQCVQLVLFSFTLRHWRHHIRWIFKSRFSPYIWWLYWVQDCFRWLFSLPSKDGYRHGSHCCGSESGKMMRIRILNIFTASSYCTQFKEKDCYLPYQGSVYWKTPALPPAGEYQPMSFGGKNYKRRREKRGKCKKGRKGKEKEKMGGKRV